VRNSSPKLERRGGPLVGVALRFVGKTARAFDGRACSIGTESVLGPRPCQNDRSERRRGLGRLRAWADRTLWNLPSGWYVKGVMGIDGVALVHCSKPKLLKKLVATPLGDDFAEQLKRLMVAAQSGEDLPLAVSLSVLGAGADFAKIFTGVRFQELESDPVFAQMLAHRILEVLPAGAHQDERGILFYPDVAEPFAETYSEAITELERGSIWASTAAVDTETRRAWQLARTNKIEEGMANAQAMMANAAADPQKFFADRMRASGDAMRAHIGELGVFSPSAEQLLHPELRPKSIAPEELADSNRKFLDRIRKVGTPEQVKQWEQAFGEQVRQPDEDAKIRRRTSKKPKK
jgi:hypothetical protein